MNRCNLRRAALAIFAVALAAHVERASAGRPFATEDAGVLEARACEFESYAAYAKSRDDPEERGGSVQVGCGVGVNTQLAVVAARFTSRDAHETVAGITGKTALRPLTETDAGVTLAYWLHARRLPDSGMRHERSALLLVLTVPRDRTLLHANLGALRTESDGRTVAAYALAVERLGEGGLDLGLEVFGQGSESPWIGAGARYALRPQQLSVDASFAVQTSGARNRVLTVGVKYTF